MFLLRKISCSLNSGIGGPRHWWVGGVQHVSWITLCNCRIICQAPWICQAHTLKCGRQVINVYKCRYEKGARLWPYVHTNIVIALFIQQIALIGLFSVKRALMCALFSLPLPVLTLLFHVYCTKKFYPSFLNYPLQVSPLTSAPQILGLLATNVSCLQSCMSCGHQTQKENAQIRYG